MGIIKNENIAVVALRKLHFFQCALLYGNVHQFVQNNVLKQLTECVRNLLSAGHKQIITEHYNLWLIIKDSFMLKKLDVNF